MDLTGKGSSNEFGLLPVGWYSAVVTKAEIKPTKDGTGKYINTAFTIVGPEYAGRIVFHMYNLENKNPKAVEIAEQQMANTLLSIGYKEDKLKDLTIEGLPGMIINKPVGIRLKVQADTTGQYEDKNVVIAYKSSASASTPDVAGPTITTSDIPF